MNSYQPYVYMIGWSSLNRYYIGVRYRRGCNPSDFFTTYFTSSKIVHAFMYLHGKPDFVMIRPFEDKEAALAAENGLIGYLNAVRSPRYLNRNRNGAHFISNPGYKQSPETCAKKSATLKGRPSGRKGTKTQPCSDETKAKISAKNSGRVLSDERKAEISKQQAGKKRKPMSPETRALLSERACAREARKREAKQNADNHSVLRDSFDSLKASCLQFMTYQR